MDGMKTYNIHKCMDTFEMRVMESQKSIGCKDNTKQFCKYLFCLITLNEDNGVKSINVMMI